MESNTYATHRPRRNNDEDNRQTHIAATRVPPNRPSCQRQNLLTTFNNSQGHKRGPTNSRIDYSYDRNYYNNNNDRCRQQNQRNDIFNNCLQSSYDNNVITIVITITIRTTIITITALHKPVCLKTLATLSILGNNKLPLVVLDSITKRIQMMIIVFKQMN